MGCCRATPRAHSERVCERSARRYGSTGKGGLRALTLKHPGSAPPCVAFLQRLLKQIAGKIYLIVYGHLVHKSGKARRFEDQHRLRLRQIRMPGYCPELNPDEWLNQGVKTNGLGKSRPTNRTKLVAIVRTHVNRRQKQPQVCDAAR